MQNKYAEIGDIVYFWFAINDGTGNAADGATPSYVVRLAGAAASAAPVMTGTPTLLTNAGYSDGSYEIAIDTTGWAAGEYAIFSSLLISAVNPNGFVGSFNLRTAGTGALKVDTVTVSDKTGFSLAADQAVNVTKVNGTSQTAGDLAALLVDLRKRGFNKLAVTDATGAYTLYDDNSTTPLYTGTISDNSTTTIRTRMA